MRDYVASNRSAILLRLFDYLLQQSIAGRRPKESEIANELFGDDAMACGSQGSRVRVAVSRLRKKLDLHYRSRPGVRLEIPPGEYGLVVSPGPESAVPTDRSDRRKRFKPSWAVILAIFLLANIALAWWHLQNSKSHAVTAGRPKLWEPLLDNGHPIALTIGDYFMFAKSGRTQSQEEIVQDFAVSTTDDFYQSVSQSRSDSKKWDNRDLYAVSPDILVAADDIWAFVKRRLGRTVTASELNPDDMKSSNILYLGSIGTLPLLLRTPLFEASRFRCATNCRELIDMPSGRHFASDSPYLLPDGVVPRRDYGYIASVPGPAGNQILIVAGTGDAAVRQMARIVVSRDELKILADKLPAGYRSFEALYYVRTMFNLSYASSLLIARPLDASAIWDKAARRVP